MTDPDGIKNFIGAGIVQFVGGLITAIIALAVLIYLNWRLTMATLALLVLGGGLSPAAGAPGGRKLTAEDQAVADAKAVIRKVDKIIIPELVVKDRRLSEVVLLLNKLYLLQKLVQSL